MTTEYALIVAVVAALIVGAASSVTGGIRSTLERIGCELNDAQICVVKED